jgi:hypothetical protein
MVAIDSFTCNNVVLYQQIDPKLLMQTEML